MRRATVLAAVLIATLPFVAHAGATTHRQVAQYDDVCDMHFLQADAQGNDRTMTFCQSSAAYDTSGNNPITYVDSAAGKPRHIRTPYRGLVLANAQDSTATYVVYAVCRKGCESGYELYLGRRTMNGAFNRPHLLGTDAVGLARIAAHDGQWWVLWSDEHRRWEQRWTFGGGERHSAAFVQPSGATAPAVALNLSGNGLAATWTLANGQVRLAHSSATTGTWSSVGVGTSAKDRVASIAVDGATTYLSYNTYGKPVLVSNGKDGHQSWRQLPLPADLDSGDGSASVAAAGGHVWLVWNQIVQRWCSRGALMACSNKETDYVARLYSVDTRRSWLLTSYDARSHETQSYWRGLFAHGGWAHPIVELDDAGTITSEVGPV